MRSGTNSNWFYGYMFLSLFVIMASTLSINIPNSHPHGALAIQTYTTQEPTSRYLLLLSYTLFEEDELRLIQSLPLNEFTAAKYKLKILNTPSFRLGYIKIQSEDSLDYLTENISLVLNEIQNGNPIKEITSLNFKTFFDNDNLKLRYKDFDLVFEDECEANHENKCEFHELTFYPQVSSVVGEFYLECILKENDFSVNPRLGFHFANPRYNWKPLMDQPYYLNDFSNIKDFTDWLFEYGNAVEYEPPRQQDNVYGVIDNNFNENRDIETNNKDNKKEKEFGYKDYINVFEDDIGSNGSKQKIEVEVIKANKSKEEWYKSWWFMLEIIVGIVVVVLTILIGVVVKIKRIKKSSKTVTIL